MRQSIKNSITTGLTIMLLAALFQPAAARAFTAASHNSTTIRNEIETRAASGGNTLENGVLNEGAAGARVNLKTTINDQVVQDINREEKAAGRPLDLEERQRFSSPDGSATVDTRYTIKVDGSGQPGDSPPKTPFPFRGAVDSDLNKQESLDAQRTSPAVGSADNGRETNEMTNAAGDQESAEKTSPRANEPTPVLKLSIGSWLSFIGQLWTRLLGLFN